jgi:hypothetical protein
MGRRLVTYNLHLESRGEDTRRIDQFEETPSDPSQSDPQMVLVVVGDLLTLPGT